MNVFIDTAKSQHAGPRGHGMSVRASTDVGRCIEALLRTPH